VNWGCGGAVLALAAASSLAHAAPPGPSSVAPSGRYDGTLCVTVAAARATCGPVEVDLPTDSTLLIRVNDISFQLWLYPSRLSVTLTQGSMQIHEFESAYAWQGSALQFADAAKHTRYEVTLGDRKP
jgi:hypothetical protein